MEEKQQENMHYEELPRIRRVMGSLEGILKMLEKDDPKSCREIAYQLKAVSTVTRKMVFHVLKRHFQCINADNFPDDKERMNEHHLTYKAIVLVIEELRAITETFGNRERRVMMEKLDEMSQELFCEIGADFHDWHQRFGDDEKTNRDV